jgi:hypothetical protein
MPAVWIQFYPINSLPVSRFDTVLDGGSMGCTASIIQSRDILAAAAAGLIHPSQFSYYSGAQE